MSDHDDRQAQYAFSNAYRRAVRPDSKTGYIEGTLPDAHDGVSTAVMRAVWRCYADYADYADGAGSYPSYALISQLTGCSRRQVQRAVAALTDLGWLVKTQEATKTTSATYTVSLRGIATTSPHDTLSPDNTSPHDNMAIDEVTPRHLSPRHEVTPRHLGIANTSPGYSHGGSLPNQEPNQEPVEDARESARATNTPQQVEDEDQPLVGHSIDPAALDGIIMELFDRYERPLVGGLSEGLRQRLRTSGLTNEQIPTYIEDRLMEFALTDLPDRQVFAYIRDDSAKWLKVRTVEAAHRPPFYTPEETAMMEEQHRLAEAARAAFDALSPKEQAASRLRARQEFERIWNGESVEVVQ